MIARTICGIGLALLLAGTASAMSGAEFLQADEHFATGYAWGALEYSIIVQSDDPVEAAVQDSRHECFDNAGIKSNAFYKAVIRYIENHPETLARPAIYGIIHTGNEICPR